MAVLGKNNIVFINNQSDYMTKMNTFKLDHFLMYHNMVKMTIFKKVYFNGFSKNEITKKSSLK